MIARWRCRCGAVALACSVVTIGLRRPHPVRLDAQCPTCGAWVAFLLERRRTRRAPRSLDLFAAEPLSGKRE